MPDSLDPFPEPPYYAVVFTSRLSWVDPDQYAAVAERMSELAAQQPGFLGMTSVRESVGVREGLGVTVSYWSDAQSIANCREQAEHRVAQEQGQRQFYVDYRIEVCRVERTIQSQRPQAARHQQERK